MNIELMEITDEEIICYVNDNLLNISKERFWDYVVKKSLNHFCNDFYDGSQPDGHAQNCGEYTLDEYFEILTSTEIKEDIIKYLNND